jgi:hypothetical protein
VLPREREADERGRELEMSGEVRLPVVEHLRGVVDGPSTIKVEALSCSINFKHSLVK